MIVGRDIETAEADGEQPGPGRVGVEVGVDVGGVDDVSRVSAASPASP